MILLLAALLATATPADACDPASLQPKIAAAAQAIEKNDLPAAKTAVAPAAACPVKNGLTFVGHIIRADIAVREGDWQVSRAMLSDVGVHAESPLSPMAGAIRLRTDQGLGDTTAFAQDRAALLAANDQRLAVIGKRIESFRLGAGTVAAYQAAVDQGGFHRVYEFIVTPDDPAAFPLSILLTDDVQAIALIKQTQGSAASHAWFLDLYTCTSHSTLPPPPHALDGGTPDYAAIKAQILPTLQKLDLKAAPPPEHDFCRSTMWVLPGLGAKLPPPPLAP